MDPLDELMSPQRLKRLGVVYACVITRVEGECYLASFADGSRLRVLDPDGEGEKRLLASLEYERSLLNAPLGGDLRAYVRGAPFGMAESFLTGLRARRAPERLFSSVFAACSMIRELRGTLSPERGLFAELREVEGSIAGYTIWLNGLELPIGG